MRSMSRCIERETERRPKCPVSDSGSKTTSKKPTVQVRRSLLSPLYLPFERIKRSVDDDEKKKKKRNSGSIMLCEIKVN